MTSHLAPPSRLAQQSVYLRVEAGMAESISIFCGHISTNQLLVVVEKSFELKSALSKYFL
jgi:hypothetical protein